MNLENKNIEHILQRMLNDRSTDAPADAVQFARNIYRTRVVEPKPSIIQRVLAVMQVDLAPNRAAFGERGAAGSQARQMLFDAGENAVDLRVTVVDDRFDVRGQILGDGFENGVIEIASTENLIKVKIDAKSGFTFSGLSAGTYDLTIHGRDADIVLENIEFK